MHQTLDSFQASWAHIGLWKNWSKDTLSVTTVTTSLTVGYIFISAVTLFVSIVGSYCWTIFCYALHQHRSSPKPQDGLYHQEQAILRNSVSDSTTAWDLIRLGWCWRSHAPQARTRTCKLTTFPILHMSLFGAASLLSSKFYSTSAEIRISSNSCGFLNIAPGTFKTWNDTLWSEDGAELVALRTKAGWSLDYAKNCYGSTQNLQCGDFAVRNLPSETSTAECPFIANGVPLCSDPILGTNQIDTGYINTNTHLGINSKKSDAIDYRRVTTCAPLDIEDFAGISNGTFMLYLGANNKTTNDHNAVQLTFQYTIPSGNVSLPAYSLS